MKIKVTVLAILATVVCYNHAASSDQWRGRSVYQVLTDRFARTDSSTTARCNTGDVVYCGGTWRGIINKLDYIQGMGFTAVYISPVTYNLEGITPYGYAYHGFWQQDLYRVNSNFGTADDLKALSQALHNRGMYLMVDIVVNHNAWRGTANTIDYSKFNPFNQASYYNPYCLIQDYSNQNQVEDCWLGNDNVLLPDLKTEDGFVRNTYNSWIRSLVANYSIDGLRIDTTKHVEKQFFAGFLSAANVFSTGEVLDGNTAYTCDYQNYLPSVFNYPTYFQLTNAFLSPSGSIQNLVNVVNTVKNGCKDSTLLGSFSENHDQARFASKTQDLSQAKNIIAFTILADGIPFIYAGQEQHYAGGNEPANREATWLSGYNTNSELYQHVAKLNQVRNRAIAKSSNYLTYKNWVIYSDGNTIAMRKGFDGNQIITVLSNQGSSSGQFTLNLGNHGYPAGTTVLEILTCATATVDSSGNVPVSMNQGLPRILYPLAQATGCFCSGASF